MTRRFTPGITFNRHALAKAATSRIAAGLLSLALVSCTSIIDGRAVTAPGSQNEAVVSAMDTGSYSITAGAPPGDAGSDRAAQSVAEAQRMAPFVVGPWDVDNSLVNQDFLASVTLAFATNLNAALAYPAIGGPEWTEPIVRAATAHGYVTGLISGRTQKDDDILRLQNAVLRFPDPASAADAAREMAATTPPGELKLVSTVPELASTSKTLTSPWQPANCTEFDSAQLGFAASAMLDNRAVLRTFTAHGPFVLYQFIIRSSVVDACGVATRTLLAQQPLIDRYVPTEPAKMSGLPIDPSGHLWARTLWESGDSHTPWSAGVWEPSAWLHFADQDPVKMAALFTATGVKWVSQRLTTVYEARDTAGAGHLADQLSADTRALPTVAPTSSGVAGLRTANCFTRGNWYAMTSDLIKANEHVWWHFSCIAHADHYALVSYSNQEQDAKQQISAQYRILAGQ